MRKELVKNNENFEINKRWKKLQQKNNVDFRKFGT